MPTFNVSLDQELLQLPAQSRLPVHASWQLLQLMLTSKTLRNLRERKTVVSNKIRVHFGRTDIERPALGEIRSKLIDKFDDLHDNLLRVENFELSSSAGEILVD